MQTIEFRTKIKDGVIQIPARLRRKVTEDVRVILIPRGEKTSQTDIIDELMAKPLQVRGFKPLARDEVHVRE
jgi:hypothetical protein